MPQWETPRTGTYNAAVDLISRNLSHRPDKIAYIDSDGCYSYRDVAVRAEQAGAALRAIGIRPGDRVALCMLDSIEFIAVFLGALRVGIIPIPLNTLLTADDYAFILNDSGARAAVVSDAQVQKLREAIQRSQWAGEMIVSGAPESATGRTLGTLIDPKGETVPHHPTRADDIAFWLYSSGSTGSPKGTPHRHSSLMITAELFARDTLRLQEDDVVFSAAKLFFAYGLGNALTFPMSVGATCVLHAGRPSPEVVARLLIDHKVTVFCGAPTLFGSILASSHLSERGQHALRLCLSAGEALPSEIGRAWTARTGVEIVDGIGSTEMLHIYISNRPKQVRHGSTGSPVPGYEVRLVGEDGLEVGPGEIGELYVRGPTMATEYWNQPEKTAAAFVDGWLRTGDKFLVQDDGGLRHCGRADDMLKVSGIWVSPIEVENALLAHDSVLEAAVIGVTDEAGLVKSKAFVVSKAGVTADRALAQALKDFTKERLAPYKYPREIEFVAELPKTANGKIRRHVLREQEKRRRADSALVQ
jgi:benzoate-CoA ligase